MAFINHYIKEYKLIAWYISCFVLLLPGVLTYQLVSGLDPSWQLSIHLAIKNGFVFGKDFVFTYGPLGFLAAKYTLVVSKFVILAFEIFMAFCGIHIVHYAYHNSNKSRWVATFTLLLLVVLKSFSLIHLITPFFIFFIFYALRNRSLLHLAIALVLSIIGLYIKVNYGIILIGLLYITLLIAFLQSSFSWKILLSTIFLHLCTLWLLAILLNVSLLNYISSSLHLINAYNDAMNIFSHPVRFLYLAIGMAILLGVGFLINFKYYIAHLLPLYFYFLCAFLFYLLFKNGFVRADGHVDDFLHVVPVVFALLYLFSENEIRKLWGRATAFVLLLSSISLLTSGPINATALTGAPRFYSSLDYFKEVFTDVSHKNTLVKPQSHSVEFDIDSTFLKEIGNKSVDIIPWEISAVYYNNLNYNPRPVVQSYSAYDYFLDTLNSIKYASPSAPEYVLYSPQSIDNRNHIWDESITKRTLLSHYDVVVTDSVPDSEFAFNEAYYLATYPDVARAVANGDFKNGFAHFLCCGKSEGRTPCEGYNTTGYFLLKKRAKPLQWKIVSSTPAKLTFGEMYTIPKTTHLLYMYADVNYSLLGKLKRLLFQPPPFSIELTYDDGTKKTYKGVVPIAKTGLLINKNTMYFGETNLFYSSKGSKGNSIISVKFMADYGFEKDITVTLKEMKLVE